MTPIHPPGAPRGVSGTTLPLRSATALTSILLCMVLAAFISLPPKADGEENRTPLAGEEAHTELFGEPVHVPARDRLSVTAANVGVQWIPNGPTFYEVLPFGALYVWRNMDDQKRRFRDA